jgi:shikimate kinase
LFLIGARGSGKTTVAKLLAERLSWDWLDADAVLETRCGRTVRQLFEDEGEAGFRDREEAILAELCRRRRHVIATGGGVVLRQTNRERLAHAGRVVWLTADAATLWQRLLEDPSTLERRPALTVGGRTEIEDVLREREALYHVCADWTVSTANRSPGEVADIILAHVAAEPVR